MKKQTAVEWLVNEIKESLKDGDIDFLFYKLKKELIEQAKEMEKQQSYSEEEVKNILFEWSVYKVNTAFSDGEIMDYEQWFKQFKKK